MLSPEEFTWLVGILERRAARYAKKAKRAEAKGMNAALIAHLHLEAARSLLSASRIERGLELAVDVDLLLPKGPFRADVERMAGDQSDLEEAVLGLRR